MDSFPLFFHPFVYFWWILFWLSQVIFMVVVAQTENAADVVLARSLARTHPKAVMNLIKQGSESPSTLWHCRMKVRGNVWISVQRKGICCTAFKSSCLRRCHKPSSTWLLLFISLVPMTWAISCMTLHYMHMMIWACCWLTHDAHVRYVFFK